MQKAPLTMVDLFEYRVFPEEPKPVTKEELPKLLSGVGWSFPLVLFLHFCLGGLFGSLLESNLGREAARPYEDTVIVALFPSSAIVTLGLHVWKRDRSRQNLERRRAQAAVHEADGITSQCVTLLGSSEKLATPLPEALRRASAWLEKADDEYRENAFAPFWDVVEEAARSLDTFNKEARQLAGNANEYYRLLGGRPHSFPSFPVTPEMLPDPKPVVGKFRSVVRMGQKNFEFAMIWEQRKTREVLIAGFRTLGEAINNLESTVEQSLSELRSSISSDLARSVEEQISTREAIDRHAREHGRMLDNIQRRRQPF